MVESKAVNSECSARLRNNGNSRVLIKFEAYFRFANLLLELFVQQFEAFNCSNLCNSCIKRPQQADVHARESLWRISSSYLIKKTSHGRNNNSGDASYARKQEMITI